MKKKEVLHYSDRIDRIFGVDLYSHRTLRTLFDPFSNEWNETTMKKKVQILKKIIYSGEQLWVLILEYQMYYAEINKAYVEKDIKTGLAHIIQFMLQTEQTDQSIIETVKTVVSPADIKEKEGNRSDPFIPHGEAGYMEDTE